MKAFTIPHKQAQLFLDDQLIDSKHKVNRVWHHLRKCPKNPLIYPSEPEGAIYLFGTVLRESHSASDQELAFRMWYLAHQWTHGCAPSVESHS